MRAVSFVDRLVFPIPGKVHEKAICLGDVDNNGSSELVVGNGDGELFVFKGDLSSPWLQSTDLGVITVVLVGDIFNMKSNNIVVFTAEGWCHVFAVSSGENVHISPVFTQRLQANIVTGLLTDVDADGSLEVVLGLTDRVMRTYRYASSPKAVYSGKLVGLHKLEFPSQLRSISASVGVDGHPVLVVAQPGGTVVIVRCNKESVTVDSKELALRRMRNPDVSTQVLAHIKCCGVDSSQMRPYAICTLDGTLQLVQDDTIKWSLQVDHQLAWLGKMDLTGDGEDEIIACCWDGQTYILDHAKKSVRFLFEEAVCTFVCGSFRIGSHDRPVLVYVTFQGSLHIFYNIEVKEMNSRSAMDAFEQSEKVQGSNLKLTPDLIQYLLYSPQLCRS